MDCRHCNGTNVTRKGKRKDVQQYRCRCCRKYFRDTYSKRYLKEDDRHHLLSLHCEGMGTRSIAKEMEISHTCVMKTKLKIAATLPEPELEPDRIYQMDELATFIAWKKKPKRKKGKKHKKNEYYVIHAIEAGTGRHVGLVVGKRTKKNIATLAKKLLAAGAKRIYMDGLNIYPTLIPKRMHSVFARCTNKIERLNLTLRTHIKRLARKTLCFSRSINMLETDLKLYFGFPQKKPKI